MSPRTLFGLSFLLTAPLFAQPNLPPSTATTPKVVLPVQDKVDLSSPLLAVRSLAASLNRYEFVQAAQCVVDGKPELIEKIATMLDEWKELQGQILISEPRIQLQGDWAMATFSLKNSLNGTARPVNKHPAMAERLVLRHIGDQWKVTGKNVRKDNEKQPLPNDQAMGVEAGAGFLTVLATFLANPVTMEQTRSDAFRSVCQSNLKQLALAAIMVAQDFDEVYAFDKAAQKFPTASAGNKAFATLLVHSWQNALYPYTKTPSIFFCPLHVEGKDGPVPNAEEQAKQNKLMGAADMAPRGAAFTLNTHLIGLNSAALEQPSRTILFYEGKDEKLDFRHDGKSNVAFCDGHIAAVTPEEVKDLIWKP